MDEDHDRSVEARWAQALDGSADVVYLTDPAGVFTFVNAQFAAVYGYAADEIVGRASRRVLSLAPDTDDEPFWRAARAGRASPQDFVARTKGGSVITVERSASAVVEQGQVVGILAIERDVTARRAVEDTHRLAQAALDRAVDAIFWIERDSRIKYVNEAASRLLGYSRDELCAMTVPDIDVDFTPERFAEHFRSGRRQAAVCFESRQRKRDGTVFPIEVRITYLDIEGRACGCAVVRDLTERKRLERELRQVQRMEAVGRLASGIAHDFNNLLTAIVGFSELLLERVWQDAGLRRDVDEIKKAGERAARLTRQLLAFSRQQMLAPRIIDLNAVVGDMLTMLDRVIGEDIRLELAAAEGLGHANVDPGQIEQILMNLVVNARDAMPKGGRLTIGTANADIDDAFVRHNDGSVAGPYVAVRVSDTGCGMPPDVVAHAFEPFFTTKPVGKGTGLGLSTVYGIVKQSGGYITIESTPGAGTTVTSYFPRVDGPVDSTAPPRSEAPASTGSETILLVEDETAVRELARRVLERAGYTVLLARDGNDAMIVEASHPAPIHLLLSDIIMPALNGPDLAQRLVRRRPSLRVLYMSGFARLTVTPRRISDRTAFVQKPFTPDLLLSRVRDMLDRQLDQPVPVP